MSLNFPPISSGAGTLHQRGQNGGRVEMQRIGEREELGGSGGSGGTWVSPLENPLPQHPQPQPGPQPYLAEAPPMKEPAVAQTLSQIIMGVEPSGRVF